MEIVYAIQRVPEIKGRRFINAQFFTGVVADVARVFVDSAFPAIAEAYKAAGVPVVMIGAGYRATLSEPPAALVERVVRKTADDMTSAELRQAIFEANGRRPGSRTARDKLLAMYAEAHR